MSFFKDEEFLSFWGEDIDFLRSFMGIFGVVLKFSEFSAMNDRLISSKLKKFKTDLFTLKKPRTTRYWMYVNITNH